MWSCSMNRRAALLAVDRTANSEASAAAARFESAAAAHPGREAAAASARCLAADAKTGATAKTCGSPQKMPARAAALLITRTKIPSPVRRGNFHQQTNKFGPGACEID